jgi:phage tail-like protein
MPRAQSTDFLHSMRFHVDIATVDNADVLKTAGQGAGFSSVSTPEATVESVEYKEGQYMYTRKFPGNPSMSDITMARGVTRGDSTFWGWLKKCIEGGEYRANLTIKHLHRDRSLPGQPPGDGNLAALTVDSPGRIYKVEQAFPIRHKVAADMDATASEISIMELDCAYEYFDVTEGTP